MYINDSMKTIRCIADLAYEKDLGIKFISPLINDMMDEPVLYPFCLDVAADMIKNDRRIASFGADGVTVAVYAMEIFDEERLFFTSQEDENLILDNIAKNARRFSTKDFMKNPYLQNINLEEINAGDIKVERECYLARELFCYDTAVPCGRYGVVGIPRIGYFDKRYRYQRLSENGYAWMSVTPNEVCTMEDPLWNAHGKVLTLGLGLGYFAYMAAIKENVESVTVIENNGRIVDLFMKNIFPQFGEAKRKVKVITSDAVAYTDELEDGKYDYCFADVWNAANINQFDIYMKCRESLRRFKKMKTDFWINDSFLEELQGFFFLEIMDHAYEMIDASETPLIREDPAFVKIRSYVKKLSADTMIKTAYDIRKCLDYKNIDDMIQKTDLIYDKC